MNGRVIDHCCAIADGRMTAASLSDLESLLRSNPDARRQYIRFMRLNALLEHGEHVEPADLPSMHATRRPIDDSRSHPVRGHRHPWRQSLGVWYLAALLLLTASLTAVVMLRPAASPHAASPGAAPTASDSVATLTNLDHAEFAGAGETPALGSSLPAGSFHLNAGTAQLMFRSGAVVTLQGPAEFELEGDNVGRLRRGVISAWVPKRAAGFTVHAPHMKVVDLGTQFALLVDPARPAQLHVFQGRVNLDVDHAAGPITLNAGEARQVTFTDDAAAPSVAAIAPANLRNITGLPMLACTWTKLDFDDAPAASLAKLGWTGGHNLAGWSIASPDPADSSPAALVHDAKTGATQIIHPLSPAIADAAPMSWLEMSAWIHPTGTGSHVQSLRIGLCNTTGKSIATFGAHGDAGQFDTWRPQLGDRIADTALPADYWYELLMHIDLHRGVAGLWIRRTDDANAALEPVPGLQNIPLSISLSDATHLSVRGGYRQQVDNLMIHTPFDPVLPSPSHGEIK